MGKNPIDAHFLSSNEKQEITSPIIDISPEFELLMHIHRNMSKDPEEAIEELNEILPQCIKKNLFAETIYTYILIANCYKNLQEYSIALQYMDFAKKELIKNNFKSSTIKVKNILSERWVQRRLRNYYNRRAILQLRRGEFPVTYHLTLAEIYSQTGEYEKSNEQNLILIGITIKESHGIPFYYAIAQNYYDAKNYQKALEYYTKIMLLEKHGNNNLSLKNCYLKASNCYQKIGDSENALYYQNLSKISIGQTVHDTVFVKISENKKDSQIKTLHESSVNSDDIIKDYPKSNLINLEYLSLARKNYKAGEYSKAERALDKYFANICFALYDEKEIKIVKDIAHELNKANRKEKALSYLIKYESLRDTILAHQIQNHYKSNKLGAAGLKNILFTEKLQREKEFDNMLIEQLENKNSLRLKFILLLITGLIVGVGGIVYLIRISKQRKSANQKLALRSLRSQMNPHFIFNALNSVNSFISLKDERTANSFLSRFSSLMRTVMENSEYDFITLSKELEIITVYLEMEHFRFKNKFQFQIHMNEDIDEDYIKLPPMLIQPYIENAIWHGLRYKESPGELNVYFESTDENLSVRIEDTGIGRKKSAELKTRNQKKHKSIALNNINQRIKIFQDLHNIKIQLSIQDLFPEKEDTGTSITLIIPQKK